VIDAVLLLGAAVIIIGGLVLLSAYAKGMSR
jgi:hypothetical protein